MESKADINPKLLQKIADALDVSAESIKTFSEEALINSLNQQGGIALNINPLDKIIELYEKQLKEKDKSYKLLQNHNKILENRIEMLEQQIIK
jgi:transcriptional regulator with XRE-family HTH domain